MMFLRIVTVLVLYATGEANIDDHPSWSWIPKDFCGRQVGRLRIIGGDEAKLGQFPWFARLGKYMAVRGKLHVGFTCGGALITKYYVLSAAHCETDFDIVRLGQNHAGTKNCDGWRCGPPPQDISIDSFYLNHYDNVTHHNDIMLILMKTPVEFNGFILPLCLPRGNLLDQNFKGKYFKIAGWGVTDAIRNKPANKLLFVSLPMVNDGICNDLFKQPMDETQYCVGTGRGKDSCVGDSGGAMTRNAKIDGREQTFIFGIVSYGVPTCGTGPAIYTKVISFMPWILDHITKH